MSVAVIPDGSRTAAFIPDTHVGSIAQRRLDAAAAGWNASGPMVPEVALLHHIGDMCEGSDSATSKGSVLPTIEQQEVVAKAWWGSLGNAARKKPGPGNHDLDRTIGGASDTTPVAWETSWGEPVGEVITTPHFVAITLTGTGGSNPLSSGGAQTAFENAVIAAAPRPVVVMHHFALRNSHGPQNAYGVHPSGTDTDVSPFTGCVGSGTDSFLKACAARQSNLVATVHGHTHPYYDVTGVARGVALSGGRTLWTFNTGALTYLGGAPSPAGFHPLIFTLLTFKSDAIELRLRDVGAGIYIPRNGIDVVERFPL
jgi:hypothetical protein